MRSGKDLVISDVLSFAELPKVERERFAALNIRANVSVPFIKDNKLVATLAVRQSTPREWTIEEVELIRDTAERTWAAVERARAEESLRQSEERHAFLLKLGDVLGNLKNPAEIAAVASRMLGEKIHADRIPYARVVDEKEVIITGEYVNGVPSIAGVFQASDFGQMVIDAYKHNQWVIFSDVSTDPRFTPAEREAYKAINVISNASIGLVRKGKWVAAFGAHSAKPRVWTEFELNIIKETGQRMWEAIERARAQEELKEAHDMLGKKVEERTKELYNERQRLFNILEELPVTISLLTEDCHVKFGNRAYRETFGESHGRHCYDFIFGFDEPCHWCEAFKPLETGNPIIGN